MKFLFDLSLFIVYSCNVKGLQRFFPKNSLSLSSKVMFLRLRSGFLRKLLMAHMNKFYREFIKDDISEKK